MEDKTNLEDEARVVNEVNPVTRARLEDELERLKTVTKEGLELRLIWKPSEDSPLSGEVKGDLIIIYESDEVKALDVLEHEFVDYLVTLGIAPFKLISNSLIKLVNRMAYLNKEKTVEALRALLKEKEKVIESLEARLKEKI